MVFQNGSVEELFNLNDEKFVIFGTSNIAMTLMEDVSRVGMCDKILYFVDNDYSLWGQNIRYQDREYRIEAPEYLEHNTEDISIIIASTYVYDIANQLEKCAALTNRKCWFYTFVKWHPDYDMTEYLEKTRQLHQKYADQTKQFKRLQNSHKGERCFIVGNGPSLNMEDLDLLRGEFCFGANQIFLAFDRTAWRPNVYLTVNVDTFLAYRHEINKLECGIKFIDSKALDYGVEIRDALYLKHGTFAEDEEFFSSDIGRYYYNGGTVVYTALQTAVYMGFNRIYLIGVDNNFTFEKSRSGSVIKNSIQNHFYKAEDDKKIADLYATVDVGHLTESFEAAREYADKNGIRICNATRGGKLEVFPRVRLEEIIAR